MSFNTLSATAYYRGLFDTDAYELIEDEDGVPCLLSPSGRLWYPILAFINYDDTKVVRPEDLGVHREEVDSDLCEMK